MEDASASKLSKKERSRTKAAKKYKVSERKGIVEDTSATTIKPKKATDDTASSVRIPTFTQLISSLTGFTQRSVQRWLKDAEELEPEYKEQQGKRTDLLSTNDKKLKSTPCIF